MANIKVFEETQISPPPCSVPPTSLPCTYFDLMFLNRPTADYLLFYRSPQPKSILPNLKHSLSLALQHFYPLAGNLKWPQGSTKPELVYNDGDSVAFTAADADFEFDDLCDTHARDINMFRPLYPGLSGVNGSSGKMVPLIAFQITFFPEKGICIGITCSHVVADGKTIFSFIKAWASINTSGTSSIKDSSLTFYDRSPILKRLEKNEAALLNLLKESNVNEDTFHTLINCGSMVSKGAVRATFTLTRNHIERLKHWVLASIRNEANPITPWLHLSSVSVSCAYTWVSFIKARWGESLQDTTEHLLLPVDARVRLDSLAPSTYFGNCGTGLEVKAKRSELLGEQGIVTAAKLIGKAIQNLDVDGELQKGPSYYRSLPRERVLAFGGSNKFGTYETDFGWGKPKRVQINSMVDYQCVLLNDCPNDDGGMEIGFVCNISEFEAFASAFAKSLGSHGVMP